MNVILFHGADKIRELSYRYLHLEMSHSLQNPRHPLVWLLCLVFLTACETTEQMKARKVEDANLGVNKNAGGELSPPLEAANAAAQFLSSGAGFHGSF